MKLLLVQGANMASLDRRQPALYGTTTARELDAVPLRRAAELGVQLDLFYNSYGRSLILLPNSVGEMSPSWATEGS